MIYYRLILCCLLTLLLGACSSSDENNDESGVIKQKTDQIAEEAVDYIKTPIDQAKVAAKELEAHGKFVEQAKENVEQ